MDNQHFIFSDNWNGEGSGEALTPKFGTKVLQPDMELYFINPKIKELRIILLEDLAKI